MDTNAIVHVNGRYRKPDCDLLDSTHVLIRIKTGKDIRRVDLVYNDPYIRLNTDNGLYWPFNTIEMNKTGDTFTNHFFSAVIPCELHRLKYYFLIYDDHDDCLQYSESGFTRGYRHDDLAMFFIPYITKSNIFSPPTWIQNVVWYQIMPTRFNRNLSGIIDKIDYLKGLGFTGLYLNPIYYAKSYHKYDVIDYTIVDPDLGTEEDFKRLCKTAHEHGMYIMLDISFTHCSDHNEMFIDVISKGDKSRYFPMFKVNSGKDGLEYECFGMIKSMPKFETESFQTITYFANKVVKKWMGLGVDAWRLDVANEISDSMLEEIKHVIHNEKKDTYIVGEIWHNATEWISNDGLDGVTNYAVSRAILTFVCDPQHYIFQYRSAIDELIHSYTLKQLKSSMPLLDSHDTPRLRTICNDDKDKVKLALLLLLTFFGTPSIYYGTERFMAGGGDPDNRRPTNWDDKSEDCQDIQDMCRKFIQIRKEHPVIANEGTYEWIDHSELLIIQRRNDRECLFIVINSKEYDINTVLPMDDEFINLIDGCQIQKHVFVRRLGFMLLYPT